MYSDTFKIFAYGDRYKVVYYKTSSYSKRKNRTDTLANFYKNYDYCFTDELLYEQAYDAFLKIEQKKQVVSFSDDTLKDVRLSQSVSRSKSKVYEYALCNDFTFFCTFTLSAEKIDRFDLKGFSVKFGQFIRNYNRKRAEKNKVFYLVVPEQHKNCAWHLHGLLGGLSFDDLVVNEYGYYDWEDYSSRFGFISLSPIRDKKACSAYITKYVTKDFATANRDAFGHLYFASHGLKKRVFVRSGNADSNTFANDFEFENDFVKISWFDDVESVENFLL